MSATVYPINRGINRPVEFKGLKAQYIWYLGGGLLVLLILFALLYICGVSPYLCVGLIFALGIGLFAWIYRLNHTYGPYGLMKKIARRKIPRVLKVGTRRLFLTTRST